MKLAQYRARKQAAVPLVSRLLTRAVLRRHFMKSGHKISVKAGSTPAAFAEFLPAWGDLASDAVEANEFYVPRMNKAAFRILGSAKPNPISEGNRRAFF